MALITCPECGAQVSDKAAACPHCGYPLALGSEQEARPISGINSSLTHSRKIHNVTPRSHNNASSEPALVTTAAKRKRSKTYLVAGIIAILAICFFFLFWLNKEPQAEADYKAKVVNSCRSFGISVDSVELKSSYASGTKRYSLLIRSNDVAPDDAAVLYGVAMDVAAIGWANKNISAGFPVIIFKDCTYEFETGTAYKDGKIVYVSDAGAYFEHPLYEKPDSSYDDDDIKAGIYILAKKCVKNHLKSPSTAEFSAMSDCGFSKGEGNTYMMTGYVDSQNSFGAMLREQWSIMAEVNGDNVSLVMVTIGNEMYFD